MERQIQYQCREGNKTKIYGGIETCINNLAVIMPELFPEWKQIEEVTRKQKRKSLY